MEWKLKLAIAIAMIGIFGFILMIAYGIVGIKSVLQQRRRENYFTHRRSCKNLIFLSKKDLRRS